MEECRTRALAFLAKQPLRSRVRPSQVAHAIWPEAVFHSQGAAFACGKVLASLRRDGLAEFRWERSYGMDLDGWVITSQGRELDRGIKP